MEPTNPKIISNPVAFTKPSTGIPSNKILNNLPTPNEKKRMALNKTDENVTLGTKIPYKLVKEVARSNAPNARASFIKLILLLMSIPEFNLNPTGTKRVAHPKNNRRIPEIIK